MDEPKLFPPPWDWEYHPDTRKPIALASHAGDVLVATGDGEQSWADVSEPHMALLKAAPDLLAACEMALHYLKNQVDPYDHDHDEEIRSLQSAIARARGG